MLLLFGFFLFLFKLHISATRKRTVGMQKQQLRSGEMKGTILGKRKGRERETEMGGEEGLHERERERAIKPSNAIAQRIAENCLPELGSNIQSKAKQNTLNVLGKRTK